MSRADCQPNSTLGPGQQLPNPQYERRGNDDTIRNCDHFGSVSSFSSLSAFRSLSETFCTLSEAFSPLSEVFSPLSEVSSPSEARSTSDLTITSDDTRPTEAALHTARAVIRKVETTLRAESIEPSHRNDQTHILAACVVLCLNLARRTDNTTEADARCKLLNQALPLLSFKGNGEIARLGEKLTWSLLSGEHIRSSQAPPSTHDESLPIWLRRAERSSQPAADTTKEEARNPTVASGNDSERISQHSTPQPSGTGASEYNGYNIGERPPVVAGDDDIFTYLPWIDGLPDSLPSEADLNSSAWLSGEPL